MTSLSVLGSNSHFIISIWWFLFSKLLWFLIFSMILKLMKLANPIERCTVNMVYIYFYPLTSGSLLIVYHPFSFIYLIIHIEHISKPKYIVSTILFAMYQTMFWHWLWWWSTSELKSKFWMQMEKFTIIWR